MTSKVETCLHLEWGTRCVFVQIEIENGVKLKYYRDHTYVLQDGHGLVYRRNRRQILLVPNDHPMSPQPHDPLVSSQCADTPARFWTLVMLSAEQLTRASLIV